MASGFKTSCKNRTICEVLREINDLHQDDSSGHCYCVRRLLAEAEDMAKRMSKKLKSYNKEWDAEWWEKNKDYEQDLDKRLKQKYMTGEIT